MRKTISVILGGGAGTRLYPLTKQRSKPAVPLAGKYRLIDIPVSNSLNSGIENIFVLTQYNSASLNRHVANTYRFDRFRRGFVSILAAEQTPASTEWFQGTADAVRQSLPHLRPYMHDHVLILSGDQLYQMDYQKMMDFHQQNDADITIATIPVHAEDASGFGIMKTDESDQIVKFVEKPSNVEGLESRVSDDLKKQGRQYLASMGIYLFKGAALEKALDSNHTDFGKDIIPEAIASQRVFSFPFLGYWSDIGTIKSFFRSNLELTEAQPLFNIFNPDRPIYTNARMLPPAKIESATISHSIVAEASVLSMCQVHNSVIGIRSFIGAGTVVKYSIVMGNDYYHWIDPASITPDRGPQSPGIAEHCFIEGAIIDKNVSIGPRCRITNRDDIQEGEGPNFYIRDGIVILPKGATIPPDTHI